MKVFPLLGNSQKLDGGAMFGNAPKALWQKLASPDSENRILLKCRSILVQVNGKTVLFETGIGNFFEPRLKERFGVVESGNVLLESLQKIGLSHEDVDVVVLSHLHFDHAGGMMSGFSESSGPQLLFPNAQIYVSEAHFARAKTPHARDRASFVPELNELLQRSGRLQLVGEDGKHHLGDWLSFRFSHGHTPGLMISEIHSGKRKAVYVSDLIPGAAWVQASLTMGYDRFAELVIDEKKAILTEAVVNNDILLFTHDPDLVCATVTLDSGNRFQTVPCELREIFCNED